MAIRPDIDPKNAAKRSGAPKGELEKYGVWVKAEPQDIVEEPEASSTTSDDFDFDLPVDSASLPEESFLSEDEEKLLGSFDTEFETAASSGNEATTAFNSGEIPSIENIPELEESFRMEEDQVEEIEDLSSGTIDIRLDELESPMNPPSITPDAKIDMSTVQGFDAKPTSSAVEMEDVSSEFLDMIDDSPSGRPQHPSDSVDSASRFLDVDTPSADQAPSGTDLEPIDIDLQFDDTLPASTSRVPSSESASPVTGFEEVTEFDDFMKTDSSSEEKSELEAEQSEVLETPDSNVADIPAFDDLAAVERELSEGGSPREKAVADARSPAASATAPSAPDLSTEILLKIADELASIRGELVSLKTQLGDIMREPERVNQAEEPPKFDENAEAEKAGGFFDDEEDETIALTGDELDNILNTADFTEEIAEAESPIQFEPGEVLEDLEAHSEPADISILDESILPENGDYSMNPVLEPAIEEISLQKDESRSEFADGKSAGEEPMQFEEISLVGEEGVLPLTVAPEDTSYLEAEEPLSNQGLPDEQADLFRGEAPLNEAPLVEPDLSDFDFEAEEPGLSPIHEIDEELPVMETVQEEALPEEITLKGPKAKSTADETSGELEPLETIPEIEESAFAEINLHEETLKPTDEPVLEEMEIVEELPEASETLAEEIDQRTAKPAVPVSLHPDEIPTSLEDKYFVGEEEKPAIPQPKPMEKSPVAPQAPQAAETVKKPKPAPVAETQAVAVPPKDDSDRLKTEIRSVLSYLDKLLDSLPEEKIEEFARSEYFDTYKRLFEELGLV